MSVFDDFVEEEVVENPTLRAAYNSEPLHQNEPLHWDYEVNLIGEKIYNKAIHLCELCEFPILIYGRTIPCKHVFCFECARNCDKTCKRCGYKIQKVEKCAWGTVYICTHGAPMHDPKGCRRTYLSQRDLLSHHAHRHLPKTSSTKEQTVQAPSNTSVSTVQPVPNQLPMTQQQAQAQQQAAQQKQQVILGPAHSPAIQTGVPAAMAPRGLLSPSQAQPMSMPSGLPAQVGGMMLTSNSAQSSPLIPGLGGLGAGMGGQASPHMQPSISPKPSLHQQQQHQGMGMAYTGQAIQPNPNDMYRPVDVGSVSNQLPQQQQQQDFHVTPGARVQQGLQGSQPSFGQQTHFQTPTSQIQQQQQQQQQALGMAPLQPNLMTSGMHMAPMGHHQQHQQRQGAPGPHGMDSFPPQSHQLQQNVASSPGMSMTMSMANTSQPRTNNLITVPIQDESQYHPLPFVNTPMMNQAADVQVSSFNSQVRTHPGTHAQSFPLHGMAGGFPPKHSGGGGGMQSQSMMGGGDDHGQGMAFNQGQGNTGNLNFPQADVHRQVLGTNFNQRGGQGLSPRLGLNQPGNQKNVPNVGFNQPGIQQSNAPGIRPFNQGLRMNQMPGMIGAGNGGNMPRRFVQGMPMVAAARSQGVSVGAGIMPTGGGLNTQSGAGINRFPVSSGRWPSPRGMQPRMGGNQAQPRPRDSSFKQGPYYK